MISSMFVGLIFGRKEITKHKKKMAFVFTLLSGIVLLFMTVIHSWWWYLIIVFVSSIMSALAWPLLEAVYTDLLARMGRENIHMIGLKNASNSIAYMIGPILAGAMATLVGNIESFVYMGGLLIFVAVLLLIFTPVKLRLPQDEIQSWE
jgi:MFS family permease